MAHNMHRFKSSGEIVASQTVLLPLSNNKQTEVYSKFKTVSKRVHINILQ